VKVFPKNNLSRVEWFLCKTCSVCFVSFAIQNLFFDKVAFSGFLLGNHEKIAVVANDDFSLWPAKMPG